jgi:hypothetical protein
MVLFLCLEIVLQPGIRTTIIMKSFTMLLWRCNSVSPIHSFEYWFHNLCIIMILQLMFQRSNSSCCLVHSSKAALYLRRNYKLSSHVCIKLLPVSHHSYNWSLWNVAVINLCVFSLEVLLSASLLRPVRTVTPYSNLSASVVKIEYYFGIKLRVLNFSKKNKSTYL